MMAIRFTHVTWIVAVVYVGLVVLSVVLALRGLHETRPVLFWFIVVFSGLFGGGSYLFLQYMGDRLRRR